MLYGYSSYKTATFFRRSYLFSEIKQNMKFKTSSTLAFPQHLKNELV